MTLSEIRLTRGKTNIVLAFVALGIQSVDKAINAK